MAAIDNLNNAVLTLQTTVTAVSDKIDTFIAAGTTSNNDVAIQSAADAVNAAVAALNSKIQ